MTAVCSRNFATKIRHLCRSAKRLNRKLNLRRYERHYRRAREILSDQRFSYNLRLTVGESFTSHWRKHYRDVKCKIDEELLTRVIKSLEDSPYKWRQSSQRDFSSINFYHLSSAANKQFYECSQKHYRRYQWIARELCVINELQNRRRFF